MEAGNVFSQSEHILQEHFLQHDTNANELKDLIQSDLHRGWRYNADIEVIDMWEEGDGLQDNTFVKRKVSMVLMELLSDEHLAGRQHFGFKHITDAKGVRVLGSDANGLVTFELGLLTLLSVGQSRYPSVFCTLMSPTSSTGSPSDPYYD